MATQFSSPRCFNLQVLPISKTYSLASMAQYKLSCEAVRPNCRLRILIGHAGLLESLTLEITSYESKNIRIEEANIEDQPEDNWLGEGDGDACSPSSSDSSDDEIAWAGNTLQNGLCHSFQTLYF